MSAPLPLTLRGLSVRYHRGWFRPDPHRAVHRVDLEVRPGEVLALVGESGSGKTTLARAALGLIPWEEGEVRVLGEDWRALGGAARRRFRRRVQLLFQNADASLNPGLSVRQIVTESARLHRPGEDAAALVEASLSGVGLLHRQDALPRALSGGEKRRVGLAQVLLADPELLVADEPTSGLDAALQADLLDLLLARREAGRSFLLISHDLPAVAYAAGRVAVMLAGRVVEEFPRSALSTGPHHPYTWALVSASGLGEDPAPRRAEPPAGRGEGCPWRGACALTRPACATHPPLQQIGTDHRVACHALEPAP